MSPLPWSIEKKSVADHNGYPSGRFEYLITDAKGEKIGSYFPYYNAPEDNVAFIERACREAPVTT